MTKYIWNSILQNGRHGYSVHLDQRYKIACKLPYDYVLLHLDIIVSCQCFFYNACMYADAHARVCVCVRVCICMNACMHSSVWCVPECLSSRVCVSVFT